MKKYPIGTRVIVTATDQPEATHKTQGEIGTITHYAAAFDYVVALDRVENSSPPVDYGDSKGFLFDDSEVAKFAKQIKNYLDAYSGRGGDAQAKDQLIEEMARDIEEKNEEIEYLRAKRDAYKAFGEMESQSADSWCERASKVNKELTELKAALRTLSGE